MNIKAFTRNVLLDKEITDLTSDHDVHFLHANNAIPPYVEYEIVDEYGDNWAENKEIATNYVVQVDIFSKTDYTNLENKIKEKMINAGFTRNMVAHLYEEDTGLFHCALRFTITRIGE